jgi:hypothetical protein
MDPQIIVAFSLLAGTVVLGIMSTTSIRNRDNHVSNYRKTLRRGVRSRGTRSTKS